MTPTIYQYILTTPEVLTEISVRVVMCDAIRAEQRVYSSGFLSFPYVSDEAYLHLSMN